MNPREMTLEQLQEREEQRLAFQKAKAEAAIAKISKRIEEQTDQKEIERLSEVLSTHQTYNEELKVVDVVAVASDKFQTLQSKTPLRERLTIEEKTIETIK